MFKAYSTRQSGFTDIEWDEQRAPKESGLRWYDYSEDFVVRKHAAKRYDCRFAWTKPTLFADGQITLCEYDFDCSHGMGNLNEQSFDEIWFVSGFNVEGRMPIRERFNRGREGFDFCAECVYDYSVIDGCVLDWEYLSDAVNG